MSDDMAESARHAQPCCLITAVDRQHRAAVYCGDVHPADLELPQRGSRPDHGSSSPRIRIVGLTLLGVLSACLNAVVITATFPGLTALPLQMSSVLGAAGAGMLLAASTRFPLMTLLGCTALNAVTASLSSVALASLFAGARRGARSPHALAV